MNAEQKQRANELLSAWRATAYALHGDRMADLLQELAGAPEVLTATNPAQISSSTEPVMCPGCEGLPVNSNNPCAVCGKKAPAPRVPDGWRELCRRLYVELFHCDKQMTNTRDEDGEPVWRTGATVRAVLDDAKAALDATPTPPEPSADVARDAEPVGYLYTNVQSGECHVSDYDDDYRGPERAMWYIEPVYRRTKGKL